MKTLILGLAITLLYSMFIVFQFDYNRYSIQLEEIKMIADDCASAAMLFYDEEKYPLGHKIFNYQEGNKAIQFIFNQSIKKDYWSEDTEYWVAYFDDTQICYYFNKTELVHSYPFAYGYAYKDPETKRSKVILEPLVIVTIDAGRGHFRLLNLQNTIPIGIRSSGYGYRGRGIMEQ